MAQADGDRPAWDDRFHVVEVWLGWGCLNGLASGISLVFWPHSIYSIEPLRVLLCFVWGIFVVPLA